jgi:hypothetical protein
MRRSSVRDVASALCCVAYVSQVPTTGKSVVTGDLSVVGGMSVSGGLAVADTLSISGGTTLSASLSITQPTTITLDTASVGGSLLRSDALNPSFPGNVLFGSVDAGATGSDLLLLRRGAAVLMKVSGSHAAYDDRSDGVTCCLASPGACKRRHHNRRGADRPSRRDDGVGDNDIDGLSRGTSPPP